MNMTKLESIIIERGIKKGWIAKQVGISAGSISKIASGETKQPQLNVALKIAYLLNMTVEDLWGDIIDEWKEELNKGEQK